ncbi:MAG: hypothetical protein JO038_03295 [Alphaproteobacteria bacterium]|nr:hypothetical protein [Alphaproteobacteria bacterium]
MRLLPALLSLLPLAACGGSGGPAPLPVQQVTAGFPRGGLADTIQIDAVDRLALTGADLIAPDGTASPAASVDAKPRPSAREGQTVAMNPFHDVLSPSSDGGGGLLIPRDPLNAAALRSETQLLVTFSTASIPLPDPVAYRRDWGKYRLRLQFGAPPGEVQIRDLPAPEPPPR